MGGKAQKKQVQAQVTLTSTVSSGDGGPSAYNVSTGASSARALRRNAQIT